MRPPSADLVEAAWAYRHRARVTQIIRERLKGLPEPIRALVEMLAEKFHMDGDLLRLLNPKADFGAAGTKVIVAAVGPEPTSKVARVIVDKSGGELRAYDRDDNIVFASPATIGSAESPSPAGTLTVATIAPEPTYSYDPRNFQQGNNREPLTLPPGPNGPVGNMWIGLSMVFGLGEATAGIVRQLCRGKADPKRARL